MVCRHFTVFQVPKGMLQTFLPSVYILPILGFKSPRECYKQKPSKERDPQSPVSSPQGNATNSTIFFMSFTHFSGFKSPRECYKRRQFGLKYVFDGDGFKSPRECYKHEFGSEKRWVVSGFKSPRECYKPSALPLILMGLPSSFKSPRECYKLLPTRHTYAVPRGFKSPRECYKQCKLWKI